MTKLTKTSLSPIVSTYLKGKAKVAIIGAGVAGSTIALRFSELGIDTTLIEKGDSLVNGPPFCHLHAGGNLYREISEQQCLILLQQSIDTAKVFPQSINHRPTIFAVPTTDKGDPLDLLPRLEKLRAKYTELVKKSKDNKVLGEPSQYFRLFDRAELEALLSLTLPKVAQTASDWLVAFAQQTDLAKLKYPVLLIQECGMSAFRFSAIASLAIARLPSCTLQLNSQVTGIKKYTDTNKWHLSYQSNTYHSGNAEQLSTTGVFDYVINACGFKSGEIDDMVQAKRQRIVEFKAAYVAHWSQCEGLWPEVVFYGERGTPQGMAQLTPYPGGYFQLHGMTQDITLFKQGLVASSDNSAQPSLPVHFMKKIDQQWPEHLVEERTLGSIEHLSQYIPAFSQATVSAKPLFGAQQIPGDDASLRTADVSFLGTDYARTEIVKASSALTAADSILKKLIDIGIVTDDLAKRYLNEHHFPITLQGDNDEIMAKAVALALERGYPEALAKNT